MTSHRLPRVTTKNGQIAAPQAATRPHVVESPAGQRVDEYYWLRDDTRSSAEVLGYVAAENAYREAMLAPVDDRKQVLLAEFVARIPQVDTTVPARKHGYEYSTRFVQGGEYPVFVRRRAEPGALEQVLLDGNALAQGHDYFMIGGRAVSGDGRRLAWAEDTVGRRQHVVHFMDLETGTRYPEQISHCDASLAWAGDHQTLLYIEKDPETLLGVRVRRHLLGTDPAEDAIVYEEPDKAFFLGLWKSRSDRYLNIYCRSTDSTEQQVALADDPALAFRALVPRERDHKYTAEDFGDRFVLRTNRGAPNYQLVDAPADRVSDYSAWQPLVPHASVSFIEDFATFTHTLAYVARTNGVLRLFVRDWQDGESKPIEMPEAAYTVGLGHNPEVDAPILRFEFTSLRTSPSVYDIDMSSGQISLRKRDWVGDDYDPERYQTAHLHAPARDGTLIPVSIVFAKERPHDGSGALLLSGYGAYGISSDPHFDRSRLSLLDRGVAFAIAHVRGGQELGRAWYDQGRLLHKGNTFTDFIDVTRFLVEQGYAAHDRVAARGGSAGGLLMGAIANMAPEKYCAIAAHVPFVDVVTTMLDESIPLTVNEFNEWGNPKQAVYYRYILSYSPYDNVRAQAYPALFVSTGLWDSQVQYYEPLKWVARLRARKTDDRPLVLRVNMGAGHGGNSGRFAAQEQVAEEYAFLLDQLGVGQEC
jgi:oligopeptidase B